MTSSAYKSDLTNQLSEGRDDSAGASIELPPLRAAVADLLVGRQAQPAQLRHQIEHDIRHQLGTVKLLASLLTSADDVGPESRERARQILGETRWLHQLITALDDCLSDREPPALPAGEPIRLDTFAAEVVAAVQLSTFTRILLDVQEAWAYVDRLGFWRALRNLVWNAVRAAGPEGNVKVRIYSVDGWAVAQVDDNGPGFGAGPRGIASLGLGIAQDLVAATGGELEIHRGAMGGCCIRLRLPSVPARSLAGTDGM